MIFIRYHDEVTKKWFKTSKEHPDPDPDNKDLARIQQLHACGSESPSWASKWTDAYEKKENGELPYTPVPNPDWHFKASDEKRINKVLNFIGSLKKENRKLYMSRFIFRFDFELNST